MLEQRNPEYDGHRLEKEKQENIKYAAPSFEGIKRDLDSLQSDVASLALDVRKAGVDKAHDAMSYVNKNIGSLKASGTDALGKLEGQIKSRPGQSVTIAFVTGLLASYLFSRRP
jgi:ElaB/YqjD/DUF883 family membrane-anchored ribosome-binding protein